LLAALGAWFVATAHAAADGWQALEVPSESAGLPVDAGGSMPGVAWVTDLTPGHTWISRDGGVTWTPTACNGTIAVDATTMWCTDGKSLQRSDDAGLPGRRSRESRRSSQRSGQPARALTTTRR
jgi:hypothetical protein